MWNLYLICRDRLAGNKDEEVAVDEEAAAEKEEEEELEVAVEEMDDDDEGFKEVYEDEQSLGEGNCTLSFST